jgi:hypothetical protein
MVRINEKLLPFCHPIATGIVTGSYYIKCGRRSSSATSFCGEEHLRDNEANFGYAPNLAPPVVSFDDIGRLKCVSEFFMIYGGNHGNDYGIDSKTA